MFPPKRVKLRLVSVAAITLIAVSCELLADEVRFAFQIEPQPLHSAAEEFSRISNFQFIYTDSQVANTPTQGVTGVYSADQALEALLNGTGINHRYVNENTIILSGESGSGIRASDEQVEVAADSSASKSKPILDEITVTATKRSEYVRHVPISVTALSQEEILTATASGDDTRFLSEKVPNLSINSSFGRIFPRFFLRGIGNADFTPNSTQPVSFYIDEVVYEGAGVRNLPAFDLERVEVLRGPQGTLWGKNTPAGAIHVVTKKPGDELAGYARLTYGNFGAINVEGAVGGPLIDGILSVRVSMLYQSRDDWVDNRYTGGMLGGYRDTGARFQLLYTPNDALSVLLKVHTRTLDGTSRLFTGGAGVSPTSTNDASRDFVRYDSDTNNPSEVSHQGATLRIEYKFNAATLTSITAYDTGKTLSIGDLDATSTPLFVFGGEIDPAKQFTQEIRLAGTLDRSFGWLVGAYYFDDEMTYKRRQYTNFGVPEVMAQNARQDVNAWAVFGSFDFDLSDQWKLSLGARYTDESKDFDQTAFRYTPNPADIRNELLATEPLIPDTTGMIGTSNSKTTWDMSLLYALSERTNLYGRVAEGFRGSAIAGQQNGGPPNSRPLESAEPETVLSYEIGFKSDLLDRRARLSGALFYYNYDDIQLRFVGIDPESGLQKNSLGNAEGANGRGIEFEGAFQVTDNFRLSGTLAYADTEYKGPTFVPHPVTNAQVDIDGHQLWYAPKLTGSVLADYSIPVSGGESYVGTDWSYRDRRYFSAYNVEEHSGDGYWLGGIRAGYRHESGAFDLNFWVRNVAGVEERQGIIRFNDSTFFTAPRTYGIDVLTRF